VGCPVHGHNNNQRSNTDLGFAESSIILLAVLGSFASIVIAPSVPDIIQNFHSTNQNMGSFIVTIYLLGAIVGALVVLPMSQRYGRPIAYHISSILLIISNSSGSESGRSSSLWFTSRLYGRKSPVNCGGLTS